MGGDYRYRGQYAECYVRALAIAAGLNVWQADIDDDGIDLGIRYSGRIGGLRSPGIDLQIKTWQPPEGDRKDHWVYTGLSGSRYNKLVPGPTDFYDRYLVIVTVPEDRGAYVRRAADGLVFRDRAYWAPVPGPPVAESRSSVAVHVPKANVLTITSLRDLVHPALSGLEIAP